jgi:Family of unknown function (DUF5397)
MDRKTAMPNRGFEETKSAYASEDPRGLIGQFRRFGPAGPAYEVMDLDGTDRVTIEVIYSGERVSCAVADVLQDPMAETFP